MNIKKALKEHNVTITMLADRLGISYLALSKQIHGNPTVATLQKIAEAVPCDITEFFSDEAVPRIECPHCGKRFYLHATT